jgi:hypothetical protein
MKQELDILQKENGMMNASIGAELMEINLPMKLNIPSKEKEKMIKWLAKQSTPEVRNAVELEFQAKSLWEACLIGGSPEMIESLKEILAAKFDELEANDIKLLGVTRVWTMPNERAT